MVGWGGGHYGRVSIQCYNGPNDVDRLLEALKRLLPGTILQLTYPGPTKRPPPYTKPPLLLNELRSAIG
jgi:hypothetical protein